MSSSFRTPGLSRRHLMASAACGALAAGFPPLLLSQDNRPLRIGLLTSLSGTFTALGQSMRAGLQMGIADAGGQMAGRPVELLVEDDQGKPDEGVRKVRKLIAQDKVDIVCGVVSAAVALAIRDIVTDANVPAFMTNAAANALAREAASPCVFRVTKTSWMLGHTGALWCAEKIGKTGGMALGSDYAAGREYIGDFAATYAQQGGRLGRQIWTPLGTPDFAPLLMNIAAASPSFVYVFLPGADAVRFLQQMRDFRLQGKFTLLAPGALFDQEDVLPAAGDAALGGISTFQQSPDAPPTRAFATRYRQTTGKWPGECSTAAYAAAQVIQAALQATGGQLQSDAHKNKLRERLLSTPVDTVLGPMAFDARNNQAILDIYVNEVRRNSDGQPFNTVVHTYRGVQDPGPAAS